MLHPQARAALAEEAGALPLQDPSTDIAAERAEAREAALAEPREPVASVRDVDADGVPVRVYHPAPGAALPTILHAHGGGFVLNDVEVHDAVCRKLALRSGLAVVSVDYRRPPEHPFPAAPDDLSSALGWVLREGAAHGLDVTRLVAHGDSAGANLALVTALRNPGRFAALVAIYPFLDPYRRGASYAEAPGLFDRDEARWYWEQYARTPADYDDPDLAPLASPVLDTLPPTLVVTAEHDPLRDEGELLAARIAESGVRCVATRYLGMVHGFWRHEEYDAAGALMDQVVGFVRAAVGAAR